MPCCCTMSQHTYSQFSSLTSKATGRGSDRARQENLWRERERHASIQSPNLIDGLEAHPAKRGQFGNVSVVYMRREQPNSLLSVSIRTWRRRQIKCFICQRAGVHSHSLDCLPLISRRGFPEGVGFHSLCLSIAYKRNMEIVVGRQRIISFWTKKPFHFASRVPDIRVVMSREG